MPFFLIGIGLLLLMAGINGRHKELGDLWLSQMQGKGSFLNLAFVILLLGAFGAITGLRPLAVAFMSLILLVLVLSNSGTTETASLIGRFRAQLLGG